MRLLFVALPVAGHTLPLIPFAWAARAAGHDTLFATGGNAINLVIQAGLPAVKILETVDLMSEFTEYIKEHYSIPGLIAPPPSSTYENTNFIAKREEWRSAHTLFEQPDELFHPLALFFGHVGELTIDSIVRVARCWGADAVVYDPCMIVGLASAKAVGIPAFCHGFGVWHPWAMPAIPAMNAAIQRYGLTETAWTPAANIDVCPASIRSSSLDRGWPMRYTPYNSEAVLPAWLFDPPQRPRVCVTMGTATPVYGRIESFDIVIDTIARYDVDVVVLGTENVRRKPLPENIRSAEWLPLNAVLPTCSAIIHHGGAGTTFTALATGVPQLVIPQIVDQPINAAAVASRGVGIYLPEAEADATSVRNGLFRLLDDIAIRNAATQVREEISAMPSPSEVIDHLIAATSKRLANK